MPKEGLALFHFITFVIGVFFVLCALMGSLVVIFRNLFFLRNPFVKDYSIMSDITFFDVATFPVLFFIIYFF